MIREVDGVLSTVNENGVNMSVLSNAKSSIKITKQSNQFMDAVNNNNGTFTIKFSTKSIPIYVTAATSAE
jgi:hypothetical protein